MTDFKKFAITGLRKFNLTGLLHACIACRIMSVCRILRGARSESLLSSEGVLDLSRDGSRHQARKK